MSVNSARHAISKALLRPVSSRTIRVAPQSARHLSLLASARTPVVSRIATTVSKSSVASGIRFKSTDKPWGPPIVSYEELKPITEQPSDVSDLRCFVQV